MECSATAGNCGEGCQNQRFQRKQYAAVSVIKTAKKGYGLRTDMALTSNDFIFEYIGEVINEATFRRRMIQYDEEGIKHFYFMSLTKSEFVDATRKGNLGRFCNHSCSPNCYVDKWVVGDKLRMGIFALRDIRAGEELVFNYNVDRYGAEPQPCYCGEPNCVGFIGGKTQTERATKLPAATVEALGIDLGDGWDTSVSKKPRKKKASEDDEEYFSSLQPKPMDEEDTSKVMAALMQCKEKWIAVKLLERIQQCDDERVIHSVMRMHAYQILKTTLNTFIEDTNVILQILSILDGFPRLTRNKIQDSNIESTVQGLTDSENDEVAAKSKKLLQEWSGLEMAYRIRRRKIDPNTQTRSIYEDRRGQAREEETAQIAQNKSVARPIDAPKGPKNNVVQRNVNAHPNAPRQRRPNFNNPLPEGWFTAKDQSGNTYYYDKLGATTWKRPTQATDTPKGPSKAMQEQMAIQSIIDRVTKEGTPKQSTTPQAAPSQAAETPTKEPKQEKWKSLPRDKQMIIYENTVFPLVKYVVDKFRHKLPKDELKRLGKEIAKKLVASDYKNNRVSDPTARLTDKQERKIKSVVRDFLNRAVQKFGSQQGQNVAAPGDNATQAQPSKVEMDVDLSEVEDDEPDGRKRKRVEDGEEAMDTDKENKRLKELETPESKEPSPPPPPPPPAEAANPEISKEQEALKEQEEALMRENEEAQRLEDEANHTEETKAEEHDAANRKQEVLSH